MISACSFTGGDQGIACLPQRRSKQSLQIFCPASPTSAADTLVRFGRLFPAIKRRAAAAAWSGASRPVAPTCSTVTGSQQLASAPSAQSEHSAAKC